MSKYYQYRKKPKRFLALTSYTIEEFDALLPEFAKSFKKRMEKYTLTGKERTKRAYSVAYTPQSCQVSMIVCRLPEGNRPKCHQSL